MMWIATGSILCCPQWSPPATPRSRCFGVQSALQIRKMCEPRIGALFERLEREIGEAGYLVGDRPSVADTYLFVLARWGLRLARPTSLYPVLWKFTERLADAGAVGRAMARERIELQGPKAGLG